MRLDASDIDSLRPVIDATVRAVLAQIDRESPSERIAYTEAQAAELLGIERHVLRDARLRGEIAGRLAGKRIIYARSALVAYAEAAR